MHFSKLLKNIPILGFLGLGANYYKNQAKRNDLTLDKGDAFAKHRAKYNNRKYIPSFPETPETNQEKQKNSLEDIKCVEISEEELVALETEAQSEGTYTKVQEIAIGGVPLIFWLYENLGKRVAYLNFLDGKAMGKGAARHIQPSEYAEALYDRNGLTVTGFIVKAIMNSLSPPDFSDPYQTYLWQNIKWGAWFKAISDIFPFLKDAYNASKEYQKPGSKDRKKLVENIKYCRKIWEEMAKQHPDLIKKGNIIYIGTNPQASASLKNAERAFKEEGLEEEGQTELSLKDFEERYEITLTKDVTIAERPHESAVGLYFLEDMIALIEEKNPRFQFHNTTVTELLYTKDTQNKAEAVAVKCKDAANNERIIFLDRKNGIIITSLGLRRIEGEEHTQHCVAVGTKRSIKI